MEVPTVTEQAGDADPEALFVSDRELRRRINPRLGWDRFLAAVRLAEKTKSPNGRIFPKIHELWGGRYWPSVVAYLDDTIGVRKDAADNTSTPDEPEDFDATTREKAGLQAQRPQRPQVLVRQTGDAQHDGLSRPVHRIAHRR